MVLTDVVEVAAQNLICSKGEINMRDAIRAEPLKTDPILKFYILEVRFDLFFLNI